MRLPRRASDRMRLNEKKVALFFSPAVKVFPERTPFFATRTTYRLTGRPTLLIFTNEGREKEVAKVSSRLFVRDSKQGHVACGEEVSGSLLVSFHTRSIGKLSSK